MILLLLKTLHCSKKKVCDNDKYFRLETLYVLMVGPSVPDPGSAAFLTPGSGIDKKIRDKQSRSYFPELKNNF